MNMDGYISTQLQAQSVNTDKSKHMIPEQQCWNGESSAQIRKFTTNTSLAISEIKFNTSLL